MDYFINNDNDKYFEKNDLFIQESMAKTPEEKIYDLNEILPNYSGASASAYSREIGIVNVTE